MKLARGHASFELNEPQFEEPESVSVAPFTALDEDQRLVFETAPTATVFPEVGSRAMLRSPSTSGWVTVQPNRYRYLATWDPVVSVRAVLSEYLAIEVTWPR